MTVGSDPTVEVDIGVLGVDVYGPGCSFRSEAIFPLKDLYGASIQSPML